MRRCHASLALFLLGLASLLATGLAGAQSATPAASPATRPSAGTSLHGRVLRLSPDGASIATVSDDGLRLCVLVTATLAPRVCAELVTDVHQPKGSQLHPQSEFVAWSPDSTRLAITEAGFSLVPRDHSDLWVLDARSGKLTDLTPLTPDGHPGPARTAPTKAPHTFDVGPAWSPDGAMIAFIRTTLGKGNAEGDTLAVVPAAGGSVRTVLRVPLSEPALSPYGLAWAHDGQTLYYSYGVASPGDPHSGIYAVGLDGTQRRTLLASSPSLGLPASSRSTPPAGPASSSTTSLPLTSAKAARSTAPSTCAQARRPPSPCPAASPKRRRLRSRPLLRTGAHS